MENSVSPIRTLNTCRICGYQWFAKRNKEGTFVSPFCPHCHSHLWNRERKPHVKGHIGNRLTGVREKVLNMRRLNACATLVEIGEKYGVSRERVRQILASEGKETHHYVKGRTFICNNCGVSYQTHTKRGEKGHYSKLYCQGCKGKVTRKIPVSCDVCGTITYRYAAHILNKQTVNGKVRERFFCGSRCKGLWVGEHYGFTAHPENSLAGRKERIHDWDAIYQKHLETGLGAHRLARLLNLPYGTVASILWRVKKQKGLAEKVI